MTTPLPKVLHIFPSFLVGGTEMKASIIINGSVDHYRHNIVVLGGAMQAESLFIKSDNIIIHDQRKTMPSSAFGKIAFARRLIKEHAPALTVSYGWGASDAVIGNILLPHSPHIHIEEGFFDETPDKQKLVRRIVRTVAFRFATFLCVPSEVLCMVAKNSWLIPKRKIKFIPNGVDIQSFKVARGPKQSNTPVVVAIIAAIHPIKNHARLFRVFAEASRTVDLSLIVAGDGVDRLKLEAYATELGIRDKISMVGYTSDPAKILAATDIFCLSSDSEQMPLTVLEAMAASLPVVTTDVGDIKSMVAPANRGYIVDAGNEALFAQKLVEMAQNEPLRRAIGNANHEQCLCCYDRRKMVDAMIDLFNGAIATGKNRRTL